MGCNIHLVYEKRLEDGTYEAVDVPCVSSKWDALDNRNYGLFGFLADVRNYSGVKPIAADRGVPDDASPIAKEFLGDADIHSCSWILVDEFLSVDRLATIEDRRLGGARSCDPGEGKTETVEDFLGSGVFERLAELKAAGVDRIVFGFDN